MERLRRRAASATVIMPSRETMVSGSYLGEGVVVNNNVSAELHPDRYRVGQAEDGRAALECQVLQLLHLGGRRLRFHRQGDADLLNDGPVSDAEDAREVD